MEDPVLCIGGFVVLAIVVAVIALTEKKERKQIEHFAYQERILRMWASERFSPSEADTVEILTPLNPFEKGISKNEKNRRHNILIEMPRNWANEIIRQDKISRERQTEHFKSWGISRFEGSWSETCERLCRLVSANRTPSIDMLSDSEIETLNSYLLAETLGSFSPAANTAEPDKPTRWTQQKCDNCGAPLLKGVCIYCNTAYARE